MIQIFRKAFLTFSKQNHFDRSIKFGSFSSWKSQKINTDGGPDGRFLDYSCRQPGIPIRGVCRLCHQFWPFPTTKIPTDEQRSKFI